MSATMYKKQNYKTQYTAFQRSWEGTAGRNATICDDVTFVANQAFLNFILILLYSQSESSTHSKQSVYNQMSNEDWIEEDFECNMRRS